MRQRKAALAVHVVIVALGDDVGLHGAIAKFPELRARRVALTERESNTTLNSSELSTPERTFFSQWPSGRHT